MQGNVFKVPFFLISVSNAHYVNRCFALENVLLLGFVQRTIATVKILTEVPTHAVNVDVMAGILLPTFTCLNQNGQEKTNIVFFLQLTMMISGI